MDLTPLQMSVASALASGHSISTASRQTGAGRTTIYTWLKDVPSFSKACHEAKQWCIDSLRDQLHDLTRKALDTIEAILEDPKTSASLRLRAALAVLHRAQWNVPEQIRTPEQENIDKALALAEASYRQSKLAQTALTQSAIDQAVQAAHQANAVSDKTEHSPPKVGRNAPCPCRSGKKYKHCCGDLR